MSAVRRIRLKCASNPRSFLMTVLGKDFDRPKLHKASLEVMV